MQEIVNTHQAEAWNGYEGAHWAEQHGRYDTANEGFNGPLLRAAAIVEGERVLDLGCGSGQLTRIAAREAGSGRALGVDLSVPMLARARASAEAEGVGNVRFIQGDVQVHPFAEGEFDVALSRFGIMFFGDPVAAFSNVGRALRSGGRLAFVAMRAMSEPDLGPVLSVLMPYFRADAGEGDGTSPVSMANPKVIEVIL